MDRKYPYSLRSADAKIAGVCSTLGEIMGIDPTFLRIAFIAFAFFIEWEIALVAYAAIGIFLAVKKKQAAIGNPKMSDFDRMGEADRVRPSVKAMREDLDVNDRRLMAIDHHLNTPNEELAREIEALREDK